MLSSPSRSSIRHRFKLIYCDLNSWRLRPSVDRPIFWLLCLLTMTSDHFFCCRGFHRFLLNCVRTEEILLRAQRVKGRGIFL
ncbi:hypothetical protein K443DRAFT_492029 [Laccaria amethystina LaAM-08-1]|uniref:Uncharacterized protein n=1 Tax=Laccaria amethystina LaAM-08-1 TaxID=1095629 RepID=A0A0C9WHJ7_9AGAR|nr:hypothetical protein K443DRAFT_492029 [Laccaria amethystina LaAM-08-1]